MVRAHMLQRRNVMDFDGFTPSLSLTLLIAVWAFVPLGLMALTIAFTSTSVGQRLAVSAVRRIVLDVGPCYGTCPGFRLTFDANGSLHYVGTLEVALRGTYAASVPARYVERIAQALDRHGLFTARRPKQPIEDAPFTAISINFADGTTATTTSYGEDPDVWEMALLLEGVAAGTCGWHFVHSTARPDLPPGSFTLISLAPCRRR